MSWRWALLDDVSGEVIRVAEPGEAGDDAGDTVRLAVDDHAVDLHLGHETQAQLQELLAPYFRAGRPTSSGGPVGEGPASGAPAVSPDGSGSDAPAPARRDDDAVRRWARGWGMHVADHEPVTDELRDAYDRAAGAAMSMSEVAERMLRDGAVDTAVAAATRLPLKEVRELRADMEAAGDPAERS